MLRRPCDQHQQKEEATMQSSILRHNGHRLHRYSATDPTLRPSATPARLQTAPLALCAALARAGEAVLRANVVVHPVFTGRNRSSQAGACLRFARNTKECHQSPTTNCDAACAPWKAACSQLGHPFNQKPNTAGQPHVFQCVYVTTCTQKRRQRCV
ncbi:hypothetical protein GQ54DRAFT_85525 [Martensiomyces pterosporus]|nr:hypothetical protein GQ54DRAFT_85525 [Martensiomyces pterosporus]